MSAADPRVTTKNSPHTQEWSPPEPVLNKCFLGIIRAGRTKSTRGSKKRTQKILVKPDEAYNYPQHLSNLISNALYSPFILEESPLVTGRRKRITKSNPIKSFCCSLNTFRKIRLTRLRLTANRSTLPATISPNLEWRRLLGFAKTCRSSLLSEHLNWITEKNSLALCSLWFFGNIWQQTNNSILLV